MINSQDPMIKVLDKKHKMLKYMYGSKGCTQFGRTWLCTCYCLGYDVVYSQESADRFIEDHKGCEQR